MKIKDIFKFAALCLVLLAAASTTSFAQTESPTASSSSGDDERETKSDERIFVQQLTARDPLVRRQAAEELARIASPNNRRLVEGYRVQEKDKGVQVALDWALYRMNKREALFPLVKWLDSSVADQAVRYLAQLDSPQPLYVFLDKSNRKTQTRLLSVLAQIGDATTLDKLKVYAASDDQKLARAAQDAEQQINNRLAEGQPLPPMRPRQVGTVQEASP